MPVPAWVAPAIIAGSTTLMNMIGRHRERKLNERYLARQNQYNTPQWQMMRYKQAGLNPALVYTQGNPGNQATALSAPSSSPGTEFASTYNASRLADTQQSVGEARVQQTKAVTELNKLQTEVLSKNPMLDQSYVNAVVNSMIATANDKMNQANQSRVSADWMNENGRKKMDAELSLLEQKFDLGSADQKIKAEVLESKEFQNAISDIQLKFLRDFQITPAHILEFVKLLLLKIK